MTGLSTAYLVNKDALSPDKQAHHAFSLFGSSQLDLSDALAPTITEKEQLEANKDLMKCQMEAFITNLQGKVIKRLQEFEPEAKFKVDRWLREEVRAFRTKSSKPPRAEAFSNFSRAAAV